MHFLWPCLNTHYTHESKNLFQQIMLFLKFHFPKSFWITLIITAGSAILIRKEQHSSQTFFWNDKHNISSTNMNQLSDRAAHMVSGRWSRQLAILQCFPRSQSLKAMLWVSELNEVEPPPPKYVFFITSMNFGCRCLRSLNLALNHENGRVLLSMDFTVMLTVCWALSIFWRQC